MRPLAFRRALGVGVAVGLCIAPSAQATNGYFLHGYGAKAKGMAGASAAFGQDAISGATNPALIATVPDRWDAGVDVFMPRRGGSITGNFFGPDAQYSGDGEKQYYIPDFGITHTIDKDWSTALILYGNGGMNTTYRQNPFARFGSSGDAGVDLIQMYVSPTVAYRLNPHHSIGLSLNIVHQRFEALGLQAFAGRAFPGPYSESPDHVTNQGYDDSTGVGYKVGYHGKLLDQFALGASWQPKIKMTRFDKYEGLFAEHGKFDVPGNYTIGVAWMPPFATLDGLTVAVDYQWIDYSDVPSVANPLANLQNPNSPDAQIIAALPNDGAGSLNDLLAQLNSGQAMLSTVSAIQGSPLGGAFEGVSAQTADQRYGNRLGADRGPGFGWQSINVYKLGLNYRINALWEVRAGYSDNSQPVAPDQTFFNILAPGVVTKHYTAGATLHWQQHELTLCVLEAPKVTVRGNGSIPDAALPLPPSSFGGGEADIHLSERAIGISYGYRF